MRDKTIRTVGATLVLVSIAVAAIMQIGPGGDPSAITLVPEGLDPTLSVAGSGPGTDEPGATTEPVPFVYRVGVLAGVTTDNFWAFYGGEAPVWNARTFLDRPNPPCTTLTPLINHLPPSLPPLMQVLLSLPMVGR